MNVGYLVLAVIALAVALGPPLHGAADELFSAHMVQHLVLICVAAPLLAIGLPGWGLVLTWLPPAPRRATAYGIRDIRGLIPHAHSRSAGAAVAWLVHVTVLWAWHAPVLYEAALRTPVLHALEHASLLLTATAFWAMVLRRRGRRPLGAVLALFAAAGSSTALGALLTLAAEPSYPIHAATAARWHLTPLEDQQLAGLIMWVLGGLGYVGAALVLLARVLRHDGRRRTSWVTHAVVLATLIAAAGARDIAAFLYTVTR